MQSIFNNRPTTAREEQESERLLPAYARDLITILATVYILHVLHNLAAGCCLSSCRACGEVIQ